MNSKILITFVVLLSLGVSFAGCLSQEDESYYQYYFEISLENDSPAYVLVPVPVDSRDGYDWDMKISRIVNDLEIISGKGSLNLEEDWMNGPALNITFTGSIFITGLAMVYDDEHEKQDEYFFDGLSMRFKQVRNYSYSFYTSDPNIMLKHYLVSLKHIGSLDDSAEFHRELSNRILDINGWGWTTLEH